MLSELPTGYALSGGLELVRFGEPPGIAHHLAQVGECFAADRLCWEGRARIGSCDPVVAGMLVAIRAMRCHVAALVGQDPKAAEAQLMRVELFESCEIGALKPERRAAEAGIGNDRIVYLPMRGSDVPSAAEVGQVAGSRFQSTTCLAACGPSPRFAAISASRTVAWCSYTVARRPLAAPTHAAPVAALDGPGLIDCAATSGGLVPRLRPSTSDSRSPRSRNAQ